MRRRFGVVTAPHISEETARKLSTERYSNEARPQEQGGSDTELVTKETQLHSNAIESPINVEADSVEPSLVHVHSKGDKSDSSFELDCRDKTHIAYVNKATKQGVDIKVTRSDVSKLKDAKENICEIEALSSTCDSVVETTTSNDISKTGRSLPANVTSKSNLKNTLNETQFVTFSTTGPAKAKRELAGVNLKKIIERLTSNDDAKSDPSKILSSPPKLIQGQVLKGGLKSFCLPSIKETDTDGPHDYEGAQKLDKQLIPLSCHCNSECTCNDITAHKKGNNEKKYQVGETDIGKTRVTCNDEEGECIKKQRNCGRVIDVTHDESNINHIVIKGEDQNTPDFVGDQAERSRVETLSLSNEDLTISRKQEDDGRAIHVDAKGNRRAILSDDNKVSCQDNKFTGGEKAAANCDLLRNRHDGYSHSSDFNNEHIAALKAGLRKRTNDSKTDCQYNLGNEELGKDKRALASSNKGENHTNLNPVDIDSQQLKGHLENQLSNEENRRFKESHSFQYTSTVLHVKEGNMEFSFGKVEELIHSKVTMQCTKNMEQQIPSNSTNRLEIVPTLWDPQFEDLGNRPSANMLTRENILPLVPQDNDNESDQDSDSHNYSLDSLEGEENEGQTQAINAVTHNGLRSPDKEFDKDISTRKSSTDNKQDKKGKNIEIMIDQPPNHKKGELSVYAKHALGSSESGLTDVAALRIINIDNAASALDAFQSGAKETDKERGINGNHESSALYIGTTSEKVRQQQQQKPNEHQIDIEVTCDKGKTRSFDLDNLHCVHSSSDSHSDDGSIMDPKEAPQKLDLSDIAEDDIVDISSLSPPQRSISVENETTEKDKTPPPLKKSESSPNLRLPHKLRIPRLRVLDNITCLEDEDSDYDQPELPTIPIKLLPDIPPQYQAPNPRHFSPSFKRKLSHHKKETDLDQLKHMATRLNLSTRRPSYMLWKERLNSDHLGKLKALNGDRLVPRPQDSDESESDSEESRMESISYALSWLKRELIEMRTQDQVLARTLIRLRDDLREVKLQRSCAAHEELLEDAMDIEEEREILSELSCDYIPNPFSPTLKQAGLTKLNIETRRFSVF